MLQETKTEVPDKRAADSTGSSRILSSFGPRARSTVRLGGKRQQSERFTTEVDYANFTEAPSRQRRAHRDAREREDHRNLRHANPGGHSEGHCRTGADRTGLVARVRV